MITNGTSADSEEKISVLLDHFEESSNAEPTFDGAASHRWTHESGTSRPSFSDEGEHGYSGQCERVLIILCIEESEYSEGDRARTTASASHRT